MKKMLMGAALILVAGCSTTIHGVVRDKPTGNPISAATVSVGERNATTNALGAFTLKAKVKPSSALVVNAPGYFLYSASVARGRSEGRTLARDVELVPRSELAPRQ